MAPAPARGVRRAVTNREDGEWELGCFRGGPGGERTLCQGLGARCPPPVARVQAHLQLCPAAAGPQGRLPRPRATWGSIARREGMARTAAKPVTAEPVHAARGR